MKSTSLHKTKSVSVILPCRNEAQHIARCLDSLLANDYDKELLEIIVVDGMSEDGTRGMVEDYAQRYPYIKLLDNPKKIRFLKKLNKAVKNMSNKVTEFKLTNKINWYKKARIGNKFMWALKEKKYDELFIEDITNKLLIQLN